MIEARCGIRHSWVLYLDFLSSVTKSATDTLPRLVEAPVWGACPKPQWVLPGRSTKDREGGGTPFLPRAGKPVEGPLHPLGNWTSPLNPSPAFFLFFFFLGVGFKLSYFVYIAPKLHCTKDLQVQICPVFINFPSLFNLCDFNFPSLYC